MPTVLYKKKGHIGYITLNRPEAMNAMNFQLYEELSKAFIKLEEDSDAFLGIITGAGERAFSAGRDLKEAAELLKQGKPIRPPYPPPIPIFGNMELWKPLIAAINGYAVGGGLELALACDIRIAAEHARFGLMEPKRGLYPGGGGVLRLPRLIPFGLAMEVLLTADLIDAREAHRVGLVNHVVPPRELMPAAEKMAGRILANGPLAVRKVKEIAYRAMDVPLPLAWRLDLGPDVYASEDAKEGTAAFAEKRQPVWKGR